MDSSRDTLAETLQQWKVRPPADPNFRDSVWRRIDRRSLDSWPVYLRSHAATWAAVAVLTLGAAAYTGRATARARVRAEREAMVVTYLVDLDPRVQATLGR